MRGYRGQSNILSDDGFLFFVAFVVGNRCLVARDRGPEHRLASAFICGFRIVRIRMG